MFVGKVFAFFLLLAIAADYFITSRLSTFDDGAAHMDYCSCSADDVETNSGEVLRLVNKIVRRPYFRFYKVNTHKECPYWAVNLLCMSADSPCTLCTCNAEDIPLSLRDAGDMSDVNDEDIGEGLMSSVTPAAVDLWGHHSGREDERAMNNENHDDGAEWVDLAVNPEANTGFSGPMATKVWEAIYRENCLHTIAAEKLSDGAHQDSDHQSCSEFQVFFRLMSGFHSSIGINVATNFNKNGAEVEASSGESGTKEIPLFSPNCEMHKRMRSFADRRANLNFLYQFVLRAVTKAAPLFLERIDSDAYASGSGNEDSALRDELKELFSSKLMCSNTFDETKFLESSYGKALVPEMKKMMRNVSTLMDCVPCEKCRLWGKLESQGIATALKIITHHADGDGDGGCRAEQAASSTPNPTAQPLVLRRGEKVALMNLLRQLSVAVWSVKHICQE